MDDNGFCIQEPTTTPPIPWKLIITPGATHRTDHSCTTPLHRELRGILFPPFHEFLPKDIFHLLREHVGKLPVRRDPAEFEELTFQ